MADFWKQCNYYCLISCTYAIIWGQLTEENSRKCRTKVAVFKWCHRTLERICVWSIWLPLGLMWHCIASNMVTFEKIKECQKDFVSLVRHKSWWYGYYVHASLTAPPASTATFSWRFPPHVFTRLFKYKSVFPYVCCLASWAWSCSN